MQRMSELAEALTARRRHDEDVGDPREERVVGDGARAADLRAPSRNTV